MLSPFRTRQVRLDEGQVRSGDVKLGQVNLDQVKLGYVGSVKEGPVRLR